MSARRPAASVTRVVRVCISLGLLVAVGWFLGLEQLAARLVRMDARWVGLALGVSLVQVAVSAWRWRFTAGRLGIELPFGDALREYYLAVFLNQVVPGGVVGDVSRAWRHARLQTDDRPAGASAVRAVILERASGQVVMTGVAVLSLAMIPMMLGVAWWLAVVGAGAVAVGLWVATRRLGTSPGSWLRILWSDARRALLSREAAPVQFATSGVVVGCYIGTYLISARAIGIQTPLLALVPLVAPVLVTMLVPVTVAGWGVREGAAALLWGGVGLTAADGVAISVAYGFLVLLSTLPGGVVLALGPALRPSR